MKRRQIFESWKEIAEAFLGNAYHPDISPDGNLIVFFTKEKAGQQAFMIQNLASGDSREIFWAPTADNLNRQDGIIKYGEA